MSAHRPPFNNVDNLTILNGAQGVGELMNQVIGQAGPALDLARDTIGGARKSRPSVEAEAETNGTAPPKP